MPIKIKTITLKTTYSYKIQFLEKCIKYLQNFTAYKLTNILCNKYTIYIVLYLYILQAYG